MRLLVPDHFLSGYVQVSRDRRSGRDRTNFEQVAGDTVLKPLPGPLRRKSLSPALSVGEGAELV